MGRKVRKNTQKGRPANQLSSTTEDLEKVLEKIELKDKERGHCTEVSLDSESESSITVGKDASFFSEWKNGYFVRGLTNLGSSCYLNSVMQNLLAIDQLRSYLMNLDQSNSPLTMALKKFFSESGSKENSENVLSPQILFDCLKNSIYKKDNQEDSQEFLLFLLCELRTEELKGDDSSSEPTFVDVIFGGELSSTLTCKTCEFASVTCQKFYHLQIQLPKIESPSIDKKSSSESDPDKVDGRDSSMSVASCLSSYMKSEVLSGKEAWNCPKCATQQVHCENQLKTTEDSNIIQNGSPDKNHAPAVEKNENLLSTSTQQEEELAAMTDWNSTCQEPSADQSSGSCSVKNLDCVVSSSKEKTLKTADGGKASTKKIHISKAPEILTIHLVRFEFILKKSIKLSDHVSFQEKLNLNSYMGTRSDDESEYEYQLIGVVQHLGTGSIENGHYVAYVRGGEEHNKWFYASDAFVREVSLDEV